MMADLDGVIERFKNALTVKNECMQAIQKPSWIGANF